MTAPPDAETTPPGDPDGRLALIRRVWIRSTIIATAGAFLGGVAVIGAQYAFLAVSAGYPPFVQSIRCETPAQTALPEAEAPGLAMFGAGTMVSGMPQDAGPLMLPSVMAGTVVSCTVDAPGADYAAWTLSGPRPEYRAGPLDADADCQGREAFTSQGAQGLRVSTCQSYAFAAPGLYLLSVKVMSRGAPAVDRGNVAMLVRAPPPPPPAAQRIIATIVTTPHTAMQERRQAISQSLSEHGFLPTDRGYARVVYRLAEGERFVEASFVPRSAAHASAVRIGLDPNGSTVTARFSLRSGPLIDRYRAWVNGDAVVRVEVSDPAQELELPEADLPVPGRVVIPLPDNIAGAAVARLRLRRPDTETHGDAPLGQVLHLGDTEVTSRITEAGLELGASIRQSSARSDGSARPGGDGR